MQEIASQRESERRQATIMFADISGFTAMSEKMDAEEVTLLMNSCFRVLGEVAEQYGGHIDKFIGDCMMVLFGVPSAIENAPYQAVNAAVEIRNRLKQFNQDKKLATPLDIHIGINTGIVVAGRIGSDTKKEYTVMGDTVNTASRLGSVSENGQILVGHETYKETKQAFKFRELPAVSLKGKEGPVPVFEVLSVEGGKHRPQKDSEGVVFSEMVGRDKELARLELQVMKAVHGEGSIVNVVGEAGIGKSRLLAELALRDAMKRVTLLEGRAISMGRSLSFHPIIDLLKNWAEIGEDDAPKKAVGILKSAIQSVHPTEVDEILPFIATLMGLPLTGRYAERVDGIEGEALEKLIVKNLRDLITRISEQAPLVISIEDLHWADESSLALLESLFRLIKDRPIVFINVFRPGYPDTGGRIIQTVNELYSDHYVEIILRPMDESISEQFVNNILSIKELPHALREKIVQRAGGNPFFIEEIIRSLIDNGALTVANGIFGVTERIKTITIPNTIQDVIMTRIDRLDAKTRDLLKIASVIGRSFFYRVLNELVEEGEDIDGKLTHLKDIQLIRERMRLDELEYLFKHALVQETTYESILRQKRIEYHLKVADSFEKVFGKRLHEFYGILAYHYSKGEDLDRAKFYMEKAGEEALKSSASSEALIYYREALNLFLEKYGEHADPDMLAELEQKIGTALLNKGQLANAAEYFKSALNRMGEKTWEESFLNKISFLYDLLVFVTKLYLPVKKFQKLPTKREVNLFFVERNLRLCLVFTDIKKFFIESVRGNKKLMSYNLQKVEGATYVWISGSATFSISGIFLNIASKQLEYAEKFLDRDNAKDLMIYNSRLSVYYAACGNWDSIPDYDENLIKQNIKIGEINDVAIYTFYYSLIGIDQGKLGVIEKNLFLLQELGAEYEHELCKSLNYWLKCRNLVKTRQFNNALSYMDEAISFLINANNEGYLYSLSSKSIVHLLAGDLDGAENALNQATEFIKQKERWIPMHFGCYLLGLSMLNLSKLEAAFKDNKKSEIIIHKKEAYKNLKSALRNSQKFAPDKTESLRLMGRYHWLIGQQKSALKYWGKSIQAGEELGALPDLARTYMEVGKALQDPKSKYAVLNNIIADEYLEKAKKIFTELHLQWDLEQLES